MLEGVFVQAFKVLHQATGIRRFTTICGKCTKLSRSEYPMLARSSPAKRLLRSLLSPMPLSTSSPRSPSDTPTSSFKLEAHWGAKLDNLVDTLLERAKLLDGNLETTSARWIWSGILW